MKKGRRKARASGAVKARKSGRRKVGGGKVNVKSILKDVAIAGVAGGVTLAVASQIADSVPAVDKAASFGGKVDSGGVMSAALGAAMLYAASKMKKPSVRGLLKNAGTGAIIAGLAPLVIDQAGGQISAAVAKVIPAAAAPVTETSGVSGLALDYDANRVGMLNGVDELKIGTIN